MYDFAGEADPESAAILTAALDPLTSPRRGGPRLIDPAEKARTQAIIDDASLCTGDSLEVTVIVDGMPLNLGRTQRLYDQRQRETLAVRDGGCLWPGCNRPPAMTEAHHTKQWKRDNGRTDLDDGVLLCRFHHMLLHNNHWEIQRHLMDDGSNDLWLTPPASVDPDQTPLRLESKNPLRQRRPRERTG